MTWQHHSTYRGYEIERHTKRKRRPYRCEVPGSDGHHADVYTPQQARKIIDKCLKRRNNCD